MVIYCPDKYITQRICDKAVDDSLASFKLILNWFITSKIIKKPYAGLYADGNMLYFDEDSNNFVFNYNVISILN